MRWSTIVLILAVVVLAGIIWLRPGQNSQPGTGISPGQQAPDFTLSTLDGSGEISLSSLKGRPVILNFFATWCGPCRSELPQLTASAELVERAHVILVNLLGSERSRDDVLQYLAGEGIDLPALADDKNAVAELYGVRAIPFTMIIDASGMVLYRHSGVITAEELLFRLPD